MLSINQLHKEINDRENKKRNVYEKILKLCYQKIINVNKKNNDCNCFFNCPEYIYGLPLYNLMKCTIYIMEDLIEKGFKVEYYHPNILYIDWKQKPTQQIKYNTNTSNNKLEYTQYRDIMDIQHDNNNILIGNNINQNYKNEINDLGFSMENMFS